MQRLSTLSMLIAATFATSLSRATVVADAPAIGEVTFVLGAAEVRQNGKAPMPVKVGMQVRVNDLIETQSNGLVHIRFVDDALVAMRAQSRLEIVRYDYDPAKPQNSAVKMNLIEGETHAISGDAAKSARQNFRMNTPIAAIGVRGTDFTVSASPDSVRAIVNEGAIVVAPFSTACSAESLGPCNQDAVELSGLSRQMLELNADAAGVRSSLMALTPVDARAAVAQAVERAESQSQTANKEAEEKGLYNDTVTTRAVNTKLASSSDAIKAPDAVAPTPPPTPPLPPPEFTPAVAETSTALTTESQLVWGRWHEANLSNERISVSYQVAVQNGRAVTVGGSSHALFRNEAAGTLKPGLGVLSFGLDKAQAVYKSGGRAELMAVSGGSLTLDFEQALFSTALQLNHAALGDYQFATSGRIYSGGVFHSNTDTQSMAGAVSYDGKEAGYFFERTLENGSIEGLTLWNQVP